MPKHLIYTTITPLPAKIPRALVVEMLHDHKEMIELNPLVLHFEQTKPPRDAPADEYHCVWYQMTDRVQYLPGGMASGKVTYKACFHDLPLGLQTHVYAPLGLDIKDKWSVGGNAAGEPREVRELGSKAPHDGLYLKEEVDMRCTRMAAGFVKKTLDKAHGVLVERLMRKAELLDDQASATVVIAYDSDRDSFVSSTSSTLQPSGYFSPHAPARSSPPQTIGPTRQSTYMVSPLSAGVLTYERSLQTAYPTAYQPTYQDRLPPPPQPPQPQFLDQHRGITNLQYGVNQLHLHPSQRPVRELAAELPGSYVPVASPSPNLPHPDRTSMVSDLAPADYARLRMSSPGLPSPDGDDNNHNHYNQLHDSPSVTSSSSNRSSSVMSELPLSVPTTHKLSWSAQQLQPPPPPQQTEWSNNNDSTRGRPQIPQVVRTPPVRG